LQRRTFASSEFGYPGDGSAHPGDGEDHDGGLMVHGRTRRGRDAHSEEGEDKYVGWDNCSATTPQETWPIHASI
jgi:hypothetical protein